MLRWRFEKGWIAIFRNVILNSDAKFSVNPFKESSEKALHILRAMVKKNENFNSIDQILFPEIMHTAVALYPLV